jgi:hypothetical protein
MVLVTYNEDVRDINDCIFFCKLFFVLYNGRIIWKTLKTLKATKLDFDFTLKSQWVLLKIGPSSRIVYPALHVHTVKVYVFVVIK